ncbi:pyruvate, phosphate dikinase, partial [Edaphobacter sp.]|uniref:pyruvate, phosphate dikinase n=1 Tax=Edaphobacter sp. TaxID=1934404 RepID=UPI002DB6C59E
LQAEINSGVGWLESTTERRMNDPSNPLLVSVRSGSPVSMPGMMDTVLNVGLNDRSVAGLAEKSGSMCFALDSYRRLIQMFGTIVLNLPKQEFDRALHAVKSAHSVENDSELSQDALRELISLYDHIVLDHTDGPFPQDPRKQLEMAVNAVFRSWGNERAKCYRKLNGISEKLGTAVTVQAMVFGNRGEGSGTGVGFTRNPSTGARELFGEFLLNAQGEDIVAGTRTPIPLEHLANAMPDIYRELLAVVSRLENHYREVQDFEFTVESGKLFLLQTRTAKRAALAAVRTTVEMASEGMITKREALERVDPNSITEMLSSRLDLSDHDREPLTQGLAASPGAAAGRIALSADDAVEMASRGEKVVLVTQETTADDIHGMAVAAGFLTARGGATSHAAVVARGMGKCCITGAKDILVDEDKKIVQIGNKILKPGDWLSLEGSTGRVFEGKLPVMSGKPDNPHLDTLLKWATESGACLVRANADTPQDAEAGRAARAAGIGLCRTEHMFFAADRLSHIRAMIMATTAEERVRALSLLLPMQQHDFEELFRTMSPLPVTIRLLDPPLHEFLPSVAEVNAEIAAARRDEDWGLATEMEAIRGRIETLKEANPMMGHRGCRLSLSYPEILEMQVKAILQAVLAVSAEGLDPAPEIMVPLVASEEEMKALAEKIHTTASEVFSAQGQKVRYQVGAMIELPRAAVCAGRIAKHVSFLSFGTNDLTQMTYGFSRDDARSYLDSYLQQGILKTDPFITIDREGVGYLMELAVNSARAVNPKIKIGVCGEHGGDPESVQFFKDLGLDYVSCSPFRIPVAQLAAARSQIART